jgi:hypothetical protein
VADFVNDNAHRPQFWKHENDLSAIKLIGPATHFLLSMPSLSAPTLNDSIDSVGLLKEMVRLVLLILLAGLKGFSLTSDELGPLQEKF